MRYYSLQICVPMEHHEEINLMLGAKTNCPYTNSWILRIDKEEDEPFLFISHFLSLLDGKYDALKKMGVNRENISVWMNYAYDSQCNMEFLPDDMYNLGKEGIVLCVSCWDIHDYDADDEIE